MKLTIPYEEATAAQRLQAYWGSFCDADPVPAEFADDMEAAGLIELTFLSKAQGRSVMADDAFWVEKYGEEVPGAIYVLTDAGREALRGGQHG